MHAYSQRRPSWFVVEKKIKNLLSFHYLFRKRYLLNSTGFRLSAIFSLIVTLKEED